MRVHATDSLVGSKSGGIVAEVRIVFTLDLEAHRALSQHPSPASCDATNGAMRSRISAHNILSRVFLPTSFLFPQYF
jgi:hypothetical protein